MFGGKVSTVRNLLSPQQEKSLFDFLATDPVLAFDYDGTLAPIVQNAGQAELRPKTRHLLKSLCELYTCALLTGRARGDVLRHLQGIPFAQIIGNHGAEWETPSPDQDEMIRQTTQWRVKLEAMISGLQGVQIEDKRLSLSIHYRKARRKHFALDHIDRALKTLEGMRIIGGKQVINVLPRQIGGKGQAILELKALYGRSTALFVGDDLNDEEVFELPPDERIFKVRVGRGFESRADYFLEHQADMDELLELLLKYGRLKRETVLEPVSAARSRARQHLHNNGSKARALS